MERSNLLGDVDNMVSGIRLNERRCCNVEGLLGLAAPMYCDKHKMISRVQSKLIILQTLFDVYKLVSRELHRQDKTNFFSGCPTCTNGHLMKEEYQAMIDSIRERVPLKNVLFHSDPLCIENMTDSKKILFVESQSGGNRNFVDTFRSQADISRLSSDSDLVPPNLRRGEKAAVQQLLVVPLDLQIMY